MAEATTAVQLEKSWPEESAYKEELELLRVSSGMRLEGTMIPEAMKAGTAGDWSVWLKTDKLDAWTRVKIQEFCNEAKQEDDERKSIVQQILQRCTDF